MSAIERIERIIKFLSPPDPRLEELARVIRERDSLAEQLVRTQKWLERFQGTAAAQELELHDLRPEARGMRGLLVQADSYLGLWRHRYDGVRMPDDLRGEVDLLRNLMHPHVAAGGRGGTADTSASKADASERAGSTPAVPTGSVQVSPCPICGDLRTMSGNVASCLMCGATTVRVEDWW